MSLYSVMSWQPGNSKTKNELRNCIDKLQKMNTELRETIKSLNKELEDARIALQNQHDLSEANLFSVIQHLEKTIDIKKEEIKNLDAEINDFRSRLSSIDNPPAHIEQSGGTKNPDVQAYEDGPRR